MKGSIYDVLLVILFFLIVPSIVLVVVTTASNLLQTATTTGSNPVYAPNSLAAKQQAEVVPVFQVFDYGIPLLFIGAGLAAVVYGAFLKVHPVNFVLVWVILIFLTYISFILSNVMHLILSEPQLINASAKYPTILQTNNELPFFMVMFSAVYSVVILLRYRASQQG